MENGYCPYRHKCKFAHGSHELRKNNCKNSLYKTKECVVFFRDGHCGYGNRCNFLHHKKSEFERDRKRKTIL
jgi:CCCH zinc finger protein C3H-4